MERRVQRPRDNRANRGSRITVKRAFVVGLITLIPLVIVGWVLNSVLKANLTIWDFLMKKMPIIPVTYQGILGILFSLIIIVLIGFLVMLLRKKLVKWPLFGLLLGSGEILGKRISEGEGQSKRQVVLARYGGAWFFGIFTGTIVVEGETLYRVTALGAPVPVTGQLLIVSKDNILFSDMKIPDLFSLLSSFGLRSLEQVNFFPPPSDKDE